jgi:hypothetical protein
MLVAAKRIKTIASPLDQVQRNGLFCRNSPHAFFVLEAFRSRLQNQGYVKPDQSRELRNGILLTKRSVMSNTGRICDQWVNVKTPRKPAMRPEDAVASVGEGLCKRSRRHPRDHVGELTIESPDTRTKRRYEVCSGMEPLVPMENIELIRLRLDTKS